MHRMEYIMERMKFGSGDIDAVPHTVAEGCPMPVNCKKPCCYGRGKSFCFPCYQELMKTRR